MKTWHILAMPPIDRFDGIVPLGTWLRGQLWDFRSPMMADLVIGEICDRSAWARSALEALHQGREEVDWEGDFRHEPYVGALPVTSGYFWYLVVQQSNNGTCFVVSQGWSAPDLYGDVIASTTVSL
ncbi:hypothetical protein ACGF07_34880 [Kitasatospora sp. NPDC048194]|uniref:hypothetical protein n=1 Tax=Kitasatospora sp. NPDC048194 TaxID=3364045 RepID=UPI003723B59D